MSSEKKLALKAIKIGLLGDSHVGKTSICDALLNLEFSTDTTTTVGILKYETKFPLKNGKNIKLILWDSAGEERFRAVAMSSLKAVKGIVLVFDVTSKVSFQNINMWLDEINNNCNNPCLVLFGNKIDLDQKLREVTPEEIKKFCQEKNLSYFETSAKTKKGVKEGFSHIVNEAVDRIQALVPDNNNKNDNNIILENNDSSSSDKNTDKEKEEEKTGCFGRKKKKKKDKNK
jgi:small GTP-binding protein